MTVAGRLADARINLAFSVRLAESMGFKGDFREREHWMRVGDC
jgi:hypothetical protein